MNLATPVADCLQRHGLERTAGVVAVSGGPDSVALAHVCVGLLQDGKISRLIFAHVNHQLRSEESDTDETFVQGLSSLWHMEGDSRLSCQTRRIDVAAIARTEHDNLESSARRERYRWFLQVAHDENAAWITTGHTADDQAETVLFRLLRGSGVLGLGGVPECRTLDDGVRLLRPLLSVRRQVLVDYLLALQIPYRVDSSNRELRFTRNRLRHELLPQLQAQYNPALVEVLCRLAEQAQELHADITIHASQLLREAELPRAGEMLVFSTQPFQKASANLTREMFRLVWQREDWAMGEMDFECWNRLVGIVMGTSSAWDFPRRIHARRIGKVVQVYSKPL